MAVRAAEPEIVAIPTLEQDSDDPVTLHRVIQDMIGEGLRRYYPPPQKLSHELFVLLLQLKEEERTAKARSAQSRARRARRKVDRKAG